jgi:probable F420-dependent oxidoreductase
VKFGMPFFGLGPRHYARVARAAEENGFESVWIPEHLVLPLDMPPTYPYTDTGMPPITPDTPMFDPWVVLGGVATATERIRLATNVFILPLRHPIPTARSIVTLDRLSGGRVTLGAGVGWLEQEFAQVGQDFANRGRRTDEIIDILRRLWTEDVIEHHGEFYDFGPVKFAPKTLQSPNIPIEIGGSSPAALRRAGRLGDGWVEIGSRDPDELAARLEVIGRHRAEAGRDGLPFEVTAGVGTDLDAIRRGQELGVTRFVVAPTPTGGRVTPDDFVAFTARFADEVISALT